MPLDADGDGLDWATEFFRFGTDPDVAGEGVLTREDLQLSLPTLGADATRFNVLPDAEILGDDGSEAATGELIALRDAATYKPQNYRIGTASAAAEPPPPSLRLRKLRASASTSATRNPQAVLTLGREPGRSKDLDPRAGGLRPRRHDHEATSCDVSAEPREYRVPPEIGSYDTNFRLGPAPHSNETIAKLDIHAQTVMVERDKAGFIDFLSRAAGIDTEAPPKFYRMWKEVTTRTSGSGLSTQTVAVDPVNRRTQRLFVAGAGESLPDSGRPRRHCEAPACKNGRPWRIGPPGSGLIRAGAVYLRCRTRPSAELLSVCGNGRGTRGICLREAWTI